MNHSTRVVIAIGIAVGLGLALAINVLSEKWRAVLSLLGGVSLLWDLAGGGSLLVPTQLLFSALHLSPAVAY